MKILKPLVVFLLLSGIFTSFSANAINKLNRQEDQNIDNGQKIKKQDGLMESGTPAEMKAMMAEMKQKMDEINNKIDNMMKMNNMKSMMDKMMKNHFESIDENKDGLIDSKEWLDAFYREDTNHDGYVNFTEFKNECKKHMSTMNH